MRSRLSLWVGNFSEEEVLEGEDSREKKVVNSARGKKGRRRRILYSGDDGSDTDSDGALKERTTLESESVLSSHAVLSRHRKSRGGETMVPFPKPRPKRSSGGVVGVWEQEASSDKEGSTMTLLAGESFLKSVSRSSGSSGSSRLQSLSQQQADLLAE